MRFSPKTWRWLRSLYWPWIPALAQPGFQSWRLRRIREAIGHTLIDDSF
jgi:hypothetical protein